MNLNEVKMYLKIFYKDKQVLYEFSRSRLKYFTENYYHKIIDIGCDDMYSELLERQFAVEFGFIPYYGKNVCVYNMQFYIYYDDGYIISSKHLPLRRLGAFYEIPEHIFTQIAEGIPPHRLKLAYSEIEHTNFGILEVIRQPIKSLVRFKSDNELRQKSTIAAYIAHNYGLISFHEQVFAIQHLDFLDISSVPRQIPLCLLRVSIRFIKN